MLRTCSSCKQVWIIKFSIIKKRNIYERVGVTNSANLTRDVETKIHRFESHRCKHSKKDYLTSVCLKLKIKWTWCLIAKLELHKIIIIYVPSIFSHLFEHPPPLKSSLPRYWLNIILSHDSLSYQFWPQCPKQQPVYQVLVALLTMQKMKWRELGFWEGYQINTGIVLSLS